MRHLKRLVNLEDRLRTMASDRARRVSFRSCLGMAPNDVADAVARTLTDETVGLFGDVITHAAHYKEHGRLAPDGTGYVHGFVEWVWRYLPLGWSSLPAKMPVDLLTAWVKGYIPEFGWDKEPISPQPRIRCESCYLIHPNRNARGEWGGPDVCAACGAKDLSSQQFFDTRLFSRDGGVTTGQSHLNPEEIEQ